MDLIQALAAELGKDPRHVENVVHLLDEGNTIPFIARYRKELHGAMDDTSLRTLEERLQYLRGLEERREAVKKSIDEQGKLTDELTAAIDSAKTLAEVEDLYRPYKQKRRTRATMAKEKGLEPLAALLFAQERDCPRPEEAARDFVDPEKGVETVEDALQGASDIIAEQADEGAIGQFALNLKPLLMQPPVKGKVTMGLDPGYRMGCKVAVVDGTGKVLDTAVVYPTYGERQKNEAIAALATLIKKHGVEHIAIGNGTASRETEQMAVELIRQVNEGSAHVSYMIVSEAGASVYSASKLAAEEFPQYDVNLRSAVSIARRLQDPLAELVKIDPKAIGVGQYQHDMPQKQLDEALNGVVEDCVNAVGVDINTASPSLLQRVAGLNGTTAKNVVSYREENGAFTSRAQIKKVPKLGPKAFQQCAGFLRVPESRSVLDNTAVHPESYEAAKALLALSGHTLADVKEGKLSDLPARIKTYGEEKAAAEIGVGLPTLRDIMSELLKPGRDVRDELPKPILRTDVLEMKDLKPGMVLTGTVRNVIDFGVFVDIGVHQDGLVHISQVSNKFIKHPSEVVSVGDVVKVVVLEVDEKKKRISLSMKQAK